MTVRIEETQSTHAVDADGLVTGLCKMTVDQVGTTGWVTQHMVMEKLKNRAHMDAAQGGHEVVVHAFSKIKKIDHLVHDLILMDVWKTHVWPRVGGKLWKTDTVRSYLLLYHEATAASLLETLLFHDGTGASLDGDTCLDLIEYVYSRVLRLIDHQHTHGVDPLEGNLTDVQRMELKHDRLSFSLGIQCISILRFLVERCDKMCLECSSRLVEKEVLSLLAKLLAYQPWTHVQQEDRRFVYQQGEWQRSEGSDADIMADAEAQAWLAFSAVVCGPLAARIKWTPHRGEVAEKALSHMRQVVQEQLPHMHLVKESIDKMQANNVYSFEERQDFEQRGVIKIEQIPKLRRTLEEGHDWEQVSQACLNRFNTATRAEVADLVRQLAQLYA